MWTSSIGVVFSRFPLQPQLLAEIAERKQRLLQQGLDFVANPTAGG